MQLQTNIWSHDQVQRILARSDKSTPLIMHNLHWIKLGSLLTSRGACHHRDDSRDNSQSKHCRPTKHSTNQDRQFVSSIPPRNQCPLTELKLRSIGQCTVRVRGTLRGLPSHKTPPQSLSDHQLYVANVFTFTLREVQNSPSGFTGFDSHDCSSVGCERLLSQEVETRRSGCLEGSSSHANTHNT